MKLSQFSGLIGITYTDKFSISRLVKKEDPNDHTIKMVAPTEPLYKDLPCRISFYRADNPNPNPEAENPIYIEVKIICAPNHDVKKGDMITAQKIVDGVVVATYTGTANLPIVYPTHQEVLFTKVGAA